MQNIIIINIILRFHTKICRQRAGGLAVAGVNPFGREGSCSAAGISDTKARKAASAIVCVSVGVYLCKKSNFMHLWDEGEDLYEQAFSGSTA
ncbi:hypothetical protein [Serratia ficaria]|uniref:hypothetical protein n=1 Tax=Serratia ficaria TaxID=61651 RepID=UPI0021BADC42|nr:hypothetical protein [Serratia ficaria]